MLNCFNVKFLSKLLLLNGVFIKEMALLLRPSLLHTIRWLSVNLAHSQWMHAGFVCSRFYKIVSVYFSWYVKSDFITKTNAILKCGIVIYARKAFLLQNVGGAVCHWVLVVVQVATYKNTRQAVFSLSYELMPLSYELMPLVWSVHDLSYGWT